jgi:caa(3)-type oxidase subunit IV
MTYVGVFAALTVITAVEVILSVVSMPFNVVGPLVALSTTKVLLVAMYFMHLRFDSKWYTAIFAAGVPFAAVVLTVMALS